MHNKNGDKIMSAEEEKVRTVKRRYAAQYLKLPEVTGFGIEKEDTDQYVLVIHLNAESPHILQHYLSNLRVTLSGSD